MRRMLFVAILAFVFSWPILQTARAEEEEAARGDNIPAVVAKVNGREITGDQYREILHQMEIAMARSRRPGPQTPEDQKALEEQALDSLITAELLSQKAEKMGFTAEPQEVDAAIQRIQERMGGKEDMEAALIEQGLTWDTYRSHVEKSLRIEKFLKQEIYDKITIEPDEAKAFYEDNPEKFKRPEQVRARHILIQVPSDASEADKEEAMEAIKKAEQRIKDGEAFGDVAKDVSQDGSAQSGGDLGYFSRGRMVPAFEEAAFTLEKGKVSGVLETQFGYHLILVEDKKPESTVTYEEAQPRIEEFLKAQKAETEAREYVETLRAEAKIEKTPF